MTTHVRQQIREALVVALTGLATTGSNVFSSRPDDREYQASELPALAVDTVAGGDISPLSLGGVGRYLERNLQVTITATVKSVSGYQNTIDAIFSEVEAALAASVSANTLGGLVKSITPAGEPEVEISGDGEKPVARGRMIFIAPYVTALNAPTVAR